MRLFFVRLCRHIIARDRQIVHFLVRASHLMGWRYRQFVASRTAPAHAAVVLATAGAPAHPLCQSSRRHICRLSYYTERLEESQWYLQSGMIISIITCYLLNITSMSPSYVVDECGIAPPPRAPLRRVMVKENFPLPGRAALRPQTSGA